MSRPIHTLSPSNEGLDPVRLYNVIRILYRRQTLLRGGIQRQNLEDGQ